MNRSMLRRAGLLSVVVMPCVLSVGHAQTSTDKDRVPVLAELFTSEGCSSCPPADRILEWLSKEQPVDGVYVVAMSEHVTYWDHQGWKDPFGSPQFTQRQQMYGVRLGVPDIFTPQLVIDGTTQLIGSDTAALERVLNDAARSPKPRLTVEASLSGDGKLSGSVSGRGLEAGAAERADLFWAVTEDDLAVDVSRGENAKRTLHHSGVVRTLTGGKIERAGVSPVNISARVPSEWKRANLRIVAFVQSARTRRVLSIGWAGVLTAPLARPNGM